MSTIADETSSITGHLVCKIATGIFFQAAENALNGDEANDDGINNAVPTASGEEDDGEIYEVERILDDRTKKGVRVFLVRWKGYGSDEDSWEPQDNLEGAKEVLSKYLANLVNKKSKPGPSKRLKKKEKKRDKTSIQYKKDSENDDVESKDSNDEFGPVKKRGRKQSAGSNTKVLRASTKAETAETLTNNVDRVVARRKYISKNMRWITESSDESSEESDDDVDVKLAVNPISPPLSIHPDSSTDVSKPEPPAKSSNGNSGDRASLELKDHDNGDVTADEHALKIAPAAADENKNNGGASDAIEKTASAKSSSTSKKQKRSTAEIENGHPNGNNPKVTFTGVYRDLSGEIRYIAVDSKTKKRDDLCLAGAFMADGWSLCRFLSSRIRFARDGDMFADGDGHV